MKINFNNFFLTHFVTIGLLFVLIMGNSSCSKEETSLAPDGKRLTAVVNGKKFVASLPQVVKNISVVQIIGSNLTAPNSDLSGQIVVQLENPQVGVTYPMEYIKGGSTKGAVLVAFQDYKNILPNGGMEGVGSITITSLTTQRITGTFSADYVIRNASTVLAKYQITNGEFSLDF